METKVASIPIPHYCVVTAAKIEFNAVVQQLSEPTLLEVAGLPVCQGRAGRNLVTVVQTQIGTRGFKENLVNHLRENNYDLVLMIGLAGGLSPDLRAGEIVFYDTCFLFRPDAALENEDGAADARIYCDFQLSSSLRQQLMRHDLSAVFGAGLTLDFMVTKAAEKLSFGESYGAAAVDMESFDVIAAATQTGLPAAIMRIIIDEAAHTTPDFNMAIGADGEMNNLRAGLAMLLRPFAAVRFFLSLRRAMHSLRCATKIALQTEQEIKRPTMALVLARKMSA